MQKPALPPDEAARLQNLVEHFILDTPAEPVFDAITTLAAKICDTPFAAISLLDARRQWFKSAYGLGQTNETSRDVSFCGHAILKDGLTEVPDAHSDQRFNDNPLVTGDPMIRFYAGMPIHSREGFALGTLCVLDKQPRRLAAEQREAIEALGHLVETLLQFRRKEAKLAWLGSVLDLMADEVTLFDPQTLHYVYANASAQRQLGLGAGELKAHSPLESLQSLTGESLSDVLASLSSGERDALALEALQRRQDGSLCPVELRLQLVNAATPVFVSLLHDISERKAIERAQRDLLATVSHELRTPLNSINGALEVLAQAEPHEIDPPLLEMVHIARRNSRRLVRLVTELLDLEKVELGKTRFDKKAISVPEVLGEVLESNQGLALQQGVSLRLGQAPDVHVLADPDRLQQVLTNLIANAVRYSPKDKPVEITADADDHTATISVCDSGPGVPEEFRPYVFERFSQAETGGRRAGSSGLGLALVRAYVEGMGGQVSFETEPNKLTRFYVVLPLAKGADA